MAQLSASREIDVNNEESPHAKLLQALRDMGLKNIAIRLANRLIGKDPCDYRFSGDGAITFMLKRWRIDNALEVEHEAELEELYRSVYGLRGMIHRQMAGRYSLFELPLAELDNLIEMGGHMLRLVSLFQLNPTYNLACLAKGNPYLLKLFSSEFMLDEKTMMGLGVLSSTQGAERLHAWTKVMMALLTSGRQTCYEEYLHGRWLVQIAGEWPVWSQEKGAWEFPFARKFEYHKDSRHRIATPVEAVKPVEEREEAEGEGAPEKPAAPVPSCSCCERPCAKSATIEGFELSPHLRSMYSLHSPLCSSCVYMAELLVTVVVPNKLDEATRIGKLVVRCSGLRSTGLGTPSSKMR